MKLEVSKSELFLPVELFVSLERAQSLVLLIIFSGEGSKLNNSADVSNLFFINRRGDGGVGEQQELRGPKKLFSYELTAMFVMTTGGPANLGNLVPPLSSC